jgi:pimeloyl-ACP methyl ester carboxylesterase
VSTGDNVAVATGQFPLLIFGHGFMMTYDAYLFWKDNLVPSGYIIVYPTTEGSTSPNHADFGADLAFLLSMIQSEGSNSSSPFYQKVSATSAIMGHSMGGGSSFLACENNTVPTCMVTFAAANTTPSSIHAAKNVTIPALVLSGAADCVAPPADHQVPMYDSLASSCKVFISINSGVHCYFGDYNFYCTLGESTCDPVPSIARADQEATALAFAKPYLDHYLKNTPGAWAEFEDSLNVSNRITYQINCPASGIYAENNKPNIHISPNPASDFIKIEIQYEIQSNFQMKLYNIIGELVSDQMMTTDHGIIETGLDVSTLKSGVYFLEIMTNEFRIVKKVQIL